MKLLLCLITLCAIAAAHADTYRFAKLGGTNGALIAMDVTPASTPFLFGGAFGGGMTAFGLGEGLAVVDGMLIVNSGSAWGGITGTLADQADLVAALAAKLSAASAAVTYQPIITTGSLALSKLATDPLARANHTGSQLLATISDAGALAALNAVASATITDGSIVNADISTSAAIALSKLATDPLARANHTGTQAFSTITNTPTTLAGYGIVDAITAALAASTYAPKASPSVTESITITTTTVPASNPSAGAFTLYVDPSDNTLRARGSSGTITILANP